MVFLNIVVVLKVTKDTGKLGFIGGSDIWRVGINCKDKNGPGSFMYIILDT